MVSDGYAFFQQRKDTCSQISTQPSLIVVRRCWSHESLVRSTCRSRVAAAHLRPLSRDVHARARCAPLGFKGEKVSRSAKWDRSERFGARASGDPASLETAGRPVDAYLEPVLSRIPGRAGEATQE